MCHIFPILFMLLFIQGCRSEYDLKWKIENDKAIIQLEKLYSEAEEYYAEITFKSGRRLAVNLGQPDKDKIFRINNIDEQVIEIIVYSSINADNWVKL